MTSSPRVPGPRRRSALARLRGADAEAGQGSIDYTGVLAVSAVAIVAIVALTPGIGGDIRRGIGTAVCRVTSLLDGGGCTDTDAAHVPDEPCVLSNHTTGFDASVTVASVHVGGGGKFIEETMSDGSVRVTVSGHASAGAQFGVGEYAGVTVGDTTYGQGATASVTVTGNMDAGNTWIFTGKNAKHDADNFVSDAQEQAGRDAVASAAGPLGSLLNWGYGEIAGNWDPPKPDSTYVAVGAGVNGDAKASFGPGGASAEGGLTGLIGIKKNKDGSSEAYFEVDGDAAAKAGVAGVGASGSADGKIVIGVNFSKSHQATDLTISGDAGVAGGATGVTDQGSIQSLVTSALGGPPEKGVSREFEANLDLTDPQNHQDASNFLNSLGISVVRPIQGLPQTVSAGKTLFNDFKNNGDITLVDYHGTNGGLSGGGEGGLGIEFGADAGYTDNSSNATAAQYWDGAKWVPWTGCTS